MCDGNKSGRSSRLSYKQGMTLKIIPVNNVSPFIQEKICPPALKQTLTVSLADG